MTSTDTLGFDIRNIKTGLEIPTDSYSDQPYIIKANDGAWVCIVTTCEGHEGSAGQHVLVRRSTDQGKTWKDAVKLEGEEPRENSYAVMHKTPSGRIYAFYNFNEANVREIEAHHDRSKIKRVDSLGEYVFKYSDDHGKTWSPSRTIIPIRPFACDKENVYSGKIRFFWNVGKPFSSKQGFFLPFIKVGKMGWGFFAQSEGAILKSPNLDTEKDPSKITWLTLPDGELGLRTPAGGGAISEEQSLVELSDGTLYCVYRSIDGYPVETYSRDGGHTWEAPQYKRYASGRKMKNPRAANFVWKTQEGKFLYWFHNHGGPFIPALVPNADITGASRTDGLSTTHGRTPYDDRNPAWISAGIEKDSPAGKILIWSEPEVILYDDDPWIRISYPDFFEENGKAYITETQKSKARLHEIPQTFLNKLFDQFENAKTIKDGLIYDLSSKVSKAFPALPAFYTRDKQFMDARGLDLRQGLTFELWVDFSKLISGEVLLDTMTESQSGVRLTYIAKGCLEFAYGDGRSQNIWQSDPININDNKIQHVAIVLDGGPKIIFFVVDGQFHDGQDTRQFGWGRFNASTTHVNGLNQLKSSLGLKHLRIYNRALMVSEIILSKRSEVY